MGCSRVLSISLFALVSAVYLPAQSAPDPSPSSQPPAEARTIALTVPDGTPLQIALDSEVRVRKVGQPIHGRVMQPVYVFDHLVIPTGTQATGHIVAIAPVPGSTRVLSALNADFTPAHKLSVNFDQLILPGGRTIELHATVVPGSGQVVQLATAGEHQKKNAVKDAAARKMEQARAQWHDAMKQIESPGRDACLRALRRRPAPRAPAVHRCQNRLFRRALPAARLRQRIRLRRKPLLHRHPAPARKPRPRHAADASRLEAYPERQRRRCRALPTAVR